MVVAATEAIMTYGKREWAIREAESLRPRPTPNRSSCTAKSGR